MKNKVMRLRAVLEPLPGNLGWLVARLPFDPAKVWPTMIRKRVHVEIGEQRFRTSLFVETADRGHFILINKKMQKAGGVSLGGAIDLAVEPDLEERATSAPKELEAILRKQKRLAAWYEQLSDSIKRDITRTIEEIKSPEARARRVDQLAERMLLAMEGEKQLPPILEIAFRRTPAARAGWQQMTTVQRRGHLLGIFHYQSPESREKRAMKTVEDCLRIAETKRTKAAKDEDA